MVSIIELCRNALCLHWSLALWEFHCMWKALPAFEVRDAPRYITPNKKVSKILHHHDIRARLHNVVELMTDFIGCIDTDLLNMMGIQTKIIQRAIQTTSFRC
jgi:hypothetical protein